MTGRHAKREFRKLADGRWVIYERLYPSVAYPNLPTALWYAAARRMAA